jgi:ABC-type sugar transport system permease subunit
MALEPLDDLPVSSRSRSSLLNNRIVIAVLGLILLAPAALCWGSTLLVPTLQTATYSQQNLRLLDNKPQFVGMANYNRLFEDRVFSSALDFTSSLAVERFLVAGFAPPLLALLLSQFGILVRIPIRLLFTIPLALFAPVLMYLSWRLALNPITGLFQSVNNRPLLADPATARSTLLSIDAFYTFGLACSLGLIVYLVALRGTGRAAPTWRRVLVPLLVTWLVSLIAAVAYAVQIFSLSFVMTAGGPINSTLSLEMYQYNNAFRTFNFGYASSVAIVSLIVLVVLGLVAGIVTIATGLRLETVPWNKPAMPIEGSARIVMAIILVAGVVAAFGVLAFAALPMLWVWQSGSVSGDALTAITTSPFQVILNTVAPVAAAILVVQLPTVYIAALGIGALRPLGRFSEWLLLPFSPWLFVTIAPLSMAAFQNIRTAGLINTPAALQVAPGMLNVLMLFILTFFFKGQMGKWRASNQPDLASFFRTVILPSLPLAAFLAVLAIMFGQQDLFWPLLAINSPQLQTVPVLLTLVSGQFSTNTSRLAGLITAFGIPQFIISIIVLALFQGFYVDRLALGAGNAAPEAEITEPVPEAPKPSNEPDALADLLPG